MFSVFNKADNLKSRQKIIFVKLKPYVLRKINSSNPLMIMIISSFWKELLSVIFFYNRTEQPFFIQFISWNYVW